MASRSFLVINPLSGGGSAGREFDRIARKLGRFEHAFTTYAGEATPLTRRALAEGYDCIVAVGGDGTINQVANGFFEDGKPLNPAAALAVIPRGTGGDFKRTFGWSNDLDEAALRIASAKTVPIDLGRATFVGHDGKQQSAYFVNVASFGISGKVDERVNRSSKRLGGRISFALASVGALLQFRDQRVKLSIDGGPEQELPITVVSVANGRYFGGGMMVAPEAQPDDGAFNVTIWSGFTFKDFVLKARDLYSGAHVKDPRTRILRAKKLRASSEETVLLDLDGEQPGRLPASFEILPGALKLKVQG